jgi:hypothetical protein
VPSGCLEHVLVPAGADRAAAVLLGCLPRAKKLPLICSLDLHKVKVTVQSWSLDRGTSGTTSISC